MDRRIIGCFFLLISAILKIGSGIITALTFLKGGAWEVGKIPMEINLAVISLVVGLGYLIVGELEAVLEKK